MNHEKNCITYWLPKLKEAGVKIPPTIIIKTKEKLPDFETGIKKIFWMEEPTEKEINAFQNIRMVLEDAGKKVGYPFFMRTGQTSDKHSWIETCYVQKEEQIMKNLQNLCEQSIMHCQDGGLPYDVLVLRKYIETKPAFHAFNGTPINKEFRFFINDNKIRCFHPYWPEEALDMTSDCKDWKEKLKNNNELTDEEFNLLERETEKVAKVFDGYWSVDWMKGKDGQWYAIDMAVGEDSYHWPNCPLEIKS